jgi:hypothetical protein
MARRLCWAVDGSSFDLGADEKNWARRLPLDVDGLLSPGLSAG